MLPAFIERMISEREEEMCKPIDESRVTIIDGQLQVTHYQEIPGELALRIEKQKASILKEVKQHLPACINIQVLPVKKDNGESVMCGCLTIQVNAKHNKVSEIETLGNMADGANTAILRRMCTWKILESIAADMRPFFDTDETEDLKKHE